MQHLFIKSEEAQLYSVYYEPKIASDIKKGVVLCYPIGQEYIQCHRMFTTLAHKLNKEGIHVVKFDYSGTGDSSGDFSTSTITEWIKDIDKVITEFKEATDVQKIYMVGVRFGGYLSLKFSQRGSVDGVVCLSPVLEGARYLNEINRDYKVWLNGSFARLGRLESGEIESHGFLYSKKLVSEIKLIRPEKIFLPEDIPVLMIDEEQSVHNKSSLFSFKEITNRGLWKKKQGQDKEVLPIHEINEIVDWISMDGRVNQ